VTGVDSRHPPQEWIAAAVMAVVLALIVLDLVDDSFNTWFDHHSFTTDAVSTLLGLAVAALVVNRIADRRRLRDRARVMAAQGAMIAAQGLRTNQAVTSVLNGKDDRDGAADELRTYLTMMLTGAPMLMDAPQTRRFLETSQRLAAELARALVVTRDGDRPDDVAQRLSDAAGEVRASIEPLLQTLNFDQQSALWDPPRASSPDGPAGDSTAADAADAPDGDAADAADADAPDADADAPDADAPDAPDARDGDAADADAPDADAAGADADAPAADASPAAGGHQVD
jgi:hypothetical protein